MVLPMTQNTVAIYAFHREPGYLQLNLKLRNSHVIYVIAHSLVLHASEVPQIRNTSMVVPAATHHWVKAPSGVQLQDVKEDD